MANLSQCSSPVKLRAVRPGTQVKSCVAVLLGIEHAREVTLRSGDKAMRASLFLADESKPLGVELTVWGANALRIAYLRPLLILHVPNVSLRVSQYGVESLTCGAPQNIRPIDETTCDCAKSSVTSDLISWNRLRHGALDGVVMRATPAPAKIRSRPRNNVTENSRPSTTAQLPVRWVRGRVSSVKIRSVHQDIATALQAGVVKKCKGCGVESGKSCSCAHGVGFDCMLDEKKVAVRVEFGDDIVVHCAGKDLALLLMMEPEELQDSKNAQRAARILGSLAADFGEFDIGTQHIPGEPIPRLRALRF